jgi:hypothetical protein
MQTVNLSKLLNWNHHIIIKNNMLMKTLLQVNIVTLLFVF